MPRRLRARRALAGLGVAAALAVAMLAAYVVALLPQAPDTADLRRVKVDHPVVLRAADGQELAVFRRLNREWVPLARIAPVVVDALVATEDRRFFEHHGIDWRRVAGAALHTLAGDREGGSTLTQQLARNLFPEEIGRAPTLRRKLLEAITAWRIERVYSKREILETYLNTVPFLYNAYGIEMAARTYFDTSAQQLDTLQAATLVGMLKGTATYNPVLHPERARARRNVVLAQMVRHGRLAPARLQALQARPLRVDFERQRTFASPAPHLAEQLRRWLAEWAEGHGHDPHAEGLVVHTTIDLRLQRLANAAVSRQAELLQTVADVEWGLRSPQVLATDAAAYAGWRRQVTPFAHFWASRPELVEAFVRESAAFRAARESGLDDAQALARLGADASFMAGLRAEKTRLQAGFVAVDPRNGHVKAWVGSRDFATDAFDHVQQARRQPGSTFKPFVYGAAFEDGATPDDTVLDQAVAIRLPDGDVWRPSDAEAPTGRPMRLRDGLALSRNTVTAQVMQRVGPARVVEVAQALGVRRSPLEAVPSLALGTSPVTLHEMVGAYAAIAHDGQRVEPLVVTRIEDRHGRVLARFAAASEPALSRATSHALVDALRDAVDRGTGTAIRTRYGIQADVAGKTGTTQNNADAWFILMHPQLVAGAWVGFNDSRVAMRSAYWGAGGHSALHLVGDFFQQALATRALDARVAFAAPRESRGLAPDVERVVRDVGDWLRGLFGGGARGQPADAP